MLRRRFLLATSLCIGLGVASLSNAQSVGTESLGQVPGAPTPLSPLDGTEVDEANPTFTWGVVSDALEYRLFIRDDTGLLTRHRFTSNGSRVNDAAGNVVCPSATAAGTICTFQANLNLADGQEFMWFIGARNQVIAKENPAIVAAGDEARYANSGRQLIQYFQFANNPVQLNAVDYFAPRGNNQSDDGNVRTLTAQTGEIGFHFANNSDASSFRLELRTTPGNNLLTPVTVPLIDANCTTINGLYDACTIFYDPFVQIANNASDFCWRIVAINARQPNATSNPDPLAEACYANQ